MEESARVRPGAVCNELPPVLFCHSRPRGGAPEGVKQLLSSTVGGVVAAGRNFVADDEGGGGGEGHSVGEGLAQVVPAPRAAADSIRHSRVVFVALHT